MEFLSGEKLASQPSLPCKKDIPGLPLTFWKLEFFSSGFPGGRDVRDNQKPLSSMARR